MAIRKMNYANGMFISNARKVGQFTFGDFLYRVVIDPENNRYIFYVRKQVEGEYEDKISLDAISEITNLARKGLTDEEIYFKLNGITCHEDKEIPVMLNVKEEVDIDYWKSFWGSPFHIEYLTVEEETDYDN